jgi:hypothetical protein
MKKLYLSPSLLLKLALGLGISLLLAGNARAQTLKIEAQLVWGTDDPQSPNPKHHPVDPDLAKKLGKTPYRWKNYFMENRQIVEVKAGETKSKIIMSPHCTLDIKNLGSERIEVKLHGDGKQVSSHTESLSKDWVLILSGNAPNETAWLVTIRKADAPTAAK